MLIQEMRFVKYIWYTHIYIHTCTHIHVHTYEVMNQCRPTYMQIQTIILTDINECENNSTCDHTNTIGSFICECKTGYQLNNDLMTCSGMKNT